MTTPTDLNRAIAERLGWQLSIHDSAWILQRPGLNAFYIAYREMPEDMVWGLALKAYGHWSEDIGAALALVETLGIDCFRLGLYWIRREWEAWTLDTPEEQPHLAPIGQPALAAARAILAWLEAKEAK